MQCIALQMAHCSEEKMKLVLAKKILTIFSSFHRFGHTCGYVPTDVPTPEDLTTHEDTPVGVEAQVCSGASTHEDIYVSICVVPSTGVATYVTTCGDFLRCAHTCEPPR